MGETTSVNLRIEKELKQQAELLFASLGINMTTAINIFLRQSVRDQGIPFRISAARDYERVPAFEDKRDRYEHYAEYVAENLKAADKKAEEGSMKYYSSDEIRARLEEIMNEKI